VISTDGAKRARRGRFNLFLLVGFVPFVISLLAARPAAAQTVSGIPVENRAFLTFSNPVGGVDSLVAAVTMHVTKTSNIQLTMTADRATASSNDTVRYSIAWKNIGVGPATQMVISDILPASLEFAAGSVSSSGTVLTSVSGTTVRFNTQDVAPGDSGVVHFAAVVKITDGEIVNSASATYASEGEVRDATSNTVQTHIEPFRVEVAVQPLSDPATTVNVADTLSFNVQVNNPSSALELRNVTVTSTLADGLQFVSSTPEPTSINGNRTGSSPAVPGMSQMSVVQSSSSGGGTITWVFDRIAPFEKKNIVLTTRVVASAAGGLTIGVGAGSSTTGTQTPVVETTIPVDTIIGLKITKAASALEVGVGEAVGFTISVKNSGNAPIDDIVIHDLPAHGVEIQRKSVSGAVLSAAGEETLLSIGSLAPGASRTVRYVGSVVGTRGSALDNRAFAVASSGVTSDTATVVVRVHEAALLSRILMGKVWLDENGDGRQQSGERSLANAIIWSSHGETVRADSLGRFTFPDLNPGRYSFRIDPLSIPAGFENAQPVSTRVDGWSSPTVLFAVPRGRAPVMANAAPQGRVINLGTGTRVISGGATTAHITAPSNGSIIGTNKLFARVEGEPSASVQLLDNGKVVGEQSLRGDGSADFIGLDVTPGPHVLEGIVRAKSGEQRTSVKFHVSGDPKTVVRGDTAVLRAGQTQVIKLRVTDEWNQPIAQKPFANVSAKGLRILDADVDASSVGLQLPVNAEGDLLVRVVGDSAGVSHMIVGFGRNETPIDLIMLPQIRSLVVLADGEIGAGATTASYGAAVARGSLDDRTSVTLSYDSRRTNRQAFGGTFDPLGESRYAILGDASQRTVLGSATSPLSLKVEHERDWLLLGDIDTRSFGSDNSPAAYRRALPGMSGHWLNGPLDVFGFGSMVAQQIVQKQLRGDGTSGPYQLGGEVRLGTDRLVIETRDRLNASLVIARQELERFIDYDIDATTGAVLLRRPLASSDASGNPMMLVATAEQVHGESSFVGGLHAQLAGTPFKSDRDTLRIGGGYIEDQSPLGAHKLISAELGAGTSWGGSAIEAAHGETLDSSGVALHATAWLGSPSAAGTGARVEWNHVGDGFANPANPRLISGTQDMRVSGRANIGAGWALGAAYSTQSFRARGAERAQTALSLSNIHGESKLALDVGVTDESLDKDDVQTDFRSITSRLSYARRRSMSWIESTQPLHNDGPERPATFGVGTSYDLGHGIRAEASQRFLKTDTSTDGLSTLSLHSELSSGTRAWTEYQLGSSIDGPTSAALVGIGQKLRVSKTWSFDAQYERRAGLNKLPETDVARALPFAQQEQNRWAASVGTEWTPTSIKARAGLRAELHDSEQTGRGYRIFGSGEASISNSLSLLVREDTREDRQVLTTGINVTHTAQTILAAAFRPADRSDWNSLVKLEWRNDENPLRSGGTLLAGSNRRLIGATETVWTPSTGTEIGARLALRHATLGGVIAGDSSTVSSVTQYVGGRVRQHIAGRFDVRSTARVLLEQRSGLSRWDIAPAAGIRLIQGLDLEAGYRFGNLVDADFAQNGGHGFYTTLGMNLTEESARNIADFWRARLGGSNR
jgi:uncharacterized repeat protein (TIGR01451 family)